MRKLLLLTLVPLSLAAQDRFHVGLDLAHQGGASQTFVAEDYAKIESKGRTQFGLTAGYRAMSIGRVQIRVTADLRLKADADVDAGRLWFGTSRVGTLSHESVALGGEASWCGPVEVGGGLQFRHERMTLTPDAKGTVATRATTTRPWLTSHVGKTWKTAEGHRPFLRGTLSVSLDNSNEDAKNLRAGEDLVKALAPGAELGFQVGLRF